jgi:hypothetical protein
MAELVRYKEIIINGLDLASFLLITPELIRVAVPAMSGLVFVAVYIIVYLLLAIGPFFLVDIDAVIRGLDLNVHLTAILYGVLIMSWLTVIAVVTFKINEMISASTKAWITRHALLLGVCGFFLARIFAFAVAIQDLAYES